MKLLIPSGLGELYDKISILEIKAERITDPAKLAFVNKELEELLHIARDYPIDQNLYIEIKKVNEIIWDSVGQQWEKESRKEYDQELIELARVVLTENDRRAEVKKKINLQYDSDIVEVKSYNKGS